MPPGREGRQTVDWLEKHGLAGRRLREHDWSATPLGPSERWPQSCRTAVDIVLGARIPQILAWGAELTVCAYNEAFDPLFDGEVEPLGRPLIEIWGDACEQIGPLVRRARDDAQAGPQEPVSLASPLQDGEVRASFDLGFTTVHDESGAAAGVLGTAVETTGRRAAERSQRESEERHRSLFDSIDAGLCVVEMLFDEAGRAADYRFIEINAAFARQTGLAGAEGRTMRSLEPEHEEHWFEIFGEVALKREPRRFERPAAKLGRFYEVYAFPVGRPEERQVGVLFQDVARRKAAEAHRRMLIDELNHRVKNTLAIVQAMARRTFRHDGVPPDLLRAFQGRLDALADAHDLLTRENWERAWLGEIALEAAVACDGGSGRIGIDGPPVVLTPKQAVTVAIALHELCTNAIKHGALSADTGRVHFGWSAPEGPEGRLTLVWRERGGPPVEPPRRRGVGTQMIERALAQELGGTATLYFDPGGLVCVIEAALPQGETEPLSPK